MDPTAKPRVLHSTFAGRQVRSLLSLISYFGSGETRQRFLGIKISPSNLQPGYADEARAFAGRPADRNAAGALS